MLEGRRKYRQRNGLEMSTARGEFLQPLLRLQRSIATLPLLSKELSVTFFLSLILNYKSINSRTETV